MFDLSGFYKIDLKSVKSNEKMASLTLEKFYGMVPKCRDQSVPTNACSGTGEIQGVPLGIV